jgi:hypothetical protein
VQGSVSLQPATGTIGTRGEAAPGRRRADCFESEDGVNEIARMLPGRFDFCDNAPQTKIELPSLDSSLRIYEAAIKAGDAKLLECASEALQSHLMVTVYIKELEAK